ncbi:MAG: hypothetical protein ACREJM_14435, partial [Candidatus Saccharimonadales bacterium]
ARANGLKPVVGIYGQDSGLLHTTYRLTDAGNFTYEQIESTFTSPPRLVQSQTDSIMLGVINDDGSVSPLK